MQNSHIKKKEQSKLNQKQPSALDSELLGRAGLLKKLALAERRIPGCQFVGDFRMR
jgi:hypothetical protein